MVTLSYLLYPYSHLGEIYLRHVFLRWEKKRWKREKQRGHGENMHRNSAQGEPELRTLEPGGDNAIRCDTLLLFLLLLIIVFKISFILVALS